MPSTWVLAKLLLCLLSAVCCLSILTFTIVLISLTHIFGITDAHSFFTLNTLFLLKVFPKHLLMKPPCSTREPASSITFPGRDSPKSMKEVSSSSGLEPAAGEPQGSAQPHMYFWSIPPLPPEKSTHKATRVSATYMCGLIATTG